MRSHLKVYFDFEAKTAEYSDEEKGRLLLAMLRYARDGEEQTLTGNERFVFPVFRAQIDEDIKAYDTKVLNGSRGGRPVMNKEPEETENNRNKPEITENNLPEPNITEISKKEERRKKKEEKDNKDILFARFWESYPRKESKQAAMRAFDKLNPDETLLLKILESIERFRESAQWTEDNGRFIPYPATFLNGKRWEDEPIKQTSGGSFNRNKANQFQQFQQRDYSSGDESLSELLDRLDKLGIPETGG